MSFNRVIRLNGSKVRGPEVTRLSGLHCTADCFSTPQSSLCEMYFDIKVHLLALNVMFYLYEILGGHDEILGDAF